MQFYKLLAKCILDFLRVEYPPPPLPHPPFNLTRPFDFKIFVLKLMCLFKGQGITNLLLFLLNTLKYICHASDIAAVGTISIGTDDGSL